MPAYKTKTKTMPENAFTGQATQPTERELASVLGESLSLWQDLVADLQRDLKLDGEEWNCYSVKAGVVAAAAKEETQHRVSESTHGVVSGFIDSGREGSGGSAEEQALRRAF